MKNIRNDLHLLVSCAQYLPNACSVHLVTENVSLPCERKKKCDSIKSMFNVIQFWSRLNREQISVLLLSSLRAFFSFSLPICLISAINCSLFVFIARRIAVIYFSSKKLHAFRHCYFLCINGRKIHINSFTVISILVVAESGVCKSVHIWRSVELILSDFLFITMLDTELNHREQFENRKSSTLNRMKWEGISWIKYLKLNASCFIIYSSF